MRITQIPLNLLSPFMYNNNSFYSYLFIQCNFFVRYLEYQITLKNDENELETLRNESMILDQNNSDLLAQRSNLEQKLPSLEQEKQNLVKTRNFKVIKNVYTGLILIILSNKQLKFV